MAYDAKERAKELNSGATDKVPDKEEMVSMTKAELKEVIAQVKEDFKEEMKEAKDEVERLKLTYERDSAVKHIKNRGEFADDKLTIKQYGPLGPRDHQEAAIKEADVKDKLKGKVPRFVSTNAELRSLRRSQGYSPVKDKNGDEVRYMDGVLMAMPKDRYETEIAEPARNRKEIHKRAIRSDFDAIAAKHQVETFGDGIQYDGGST